MADSGGISEDQNASRTMVSKDWGLLTFFEI